MVVVLMSFKFNLRLVYDSLIWHKIPKFIQKDATRVMCYTYRLCTRRIKCWGGTNARSISTSATTIFLDSFLNDSSAELAIATI